METPTTEQITKHISAAFDSVNLINNEIEKEATENRKDNVKRNVQHLELMLNKEWFVDALSTEQSTDINAVITAGNTYTA
jgi:hypothetical protein